MGELMQPAHMYIFCWLHILYSLCAFQEIMGWNCRNNASSPPTVLGELPAWCGSHLRAVERSHNTLSHLNTLRCLWICQNTPHILQPPLLPRHEQYLRAISENVQNSKPTDPICEVSSHSTCNAHVPRPLRFTVWFSQSGWKPVPDLLHILCSKILVPTIARGWPRKRSVQTAMWVLGFCGRAAEQIFCVFHDPMSIGTKNKFSLLVWTFHDCDGAWKTPQQIFALEFSVLQDAPLEPAKGSDECCTHDIGPSLALAIHVDLGSGKAGLKLWSFVQISVTAGKVQTKQQKNEKLDLPFRNKIKNKSYSLFKDKSTREIRRICIKFAIFLKKVDLTFFSKMIESCKKLLILKNFKTWSPKKYRE